MKKWRRKKETKRAGKVYKKNNRENVESFDWREEERRFKRCGMVFTSSVCGTQTARGFLPAQTTGNNKLSWTRVERGEREGEKKKKRKTTTPTTWSSGATFRSHLSLSTCPASIVFHSWKIINKHDSMERGGSRWPACSFPMTFRIVLWPFAFFLVAFSFVGRQKKDV